MNITLIIRLSALLSVLFTIHLINYPILLLDSAVLIYKQLNIVKLSLLLNLWVCECIITCSYWPLSLLSAKGHLPNLSTLDIDAWELTLHSSSVLPVLPVLRSLTPPISSRDVPSSSTSEMEINDIYDFALQIMYHWLLSIIRLLIPCSFSPVIRIVEE